MWGLVFQISLDFSSWVTRSRGNALFVQFVLVLSEFKKQIMSQAGLQLRFKIGLETDYSKPVGFAVLLVLRPGAKP